MLFHSPEGNVREIGVHLLGGSGWPKGDQPSVGGGAILNKNGKRGYESLQRHTYQETTVDMQDKYENSHAAKSQAVTNRLHEESV